MDDPTTPAGCRSCASLGLRYMVAVRAGADVGMWVDQPDLRERIIAHIAALWAWQYGIDACADGFDAFFKRYCADVERDANPDARDPAWDCHRVWTNHASLLGGERDMVAPRPVWIVRAVPRPARSGQAG